MNKNRNSRNPLLRRLQRHNRVSTLFRSVDESPAGEQPLSPEFSTSASHLVAARAGLLPPRSRLPHGYILNSPLPASFPAVQRTVDEPPIMDEIEHFPRFEKSPQLPINPQRMPTIPVANEQPALPPKHSETPRSSFPPPEPASQTRPGQSASQSRTAVPAPSPEESKFTQRQLDRLQAIYNLHNAGSSDHDGNAPAENMPMGQSQSQPEPAEGNTSQPVSLPNLPALPRPPISETGQSSPQPGLPIQRSIDTERTQPSPLARPVQIPDQQIAAQPPAVSPDQTKDNASQVSSQVTVFRQEDEKAPFQKSSLVSSPPISSRQNLPNFSPPLSAEPDAIIAQPAQNLPDSQSMPPENVIPRPSTINQPIQRSPDDFLSPSLPDQLAAQALSIDNRSSKLPNHAPAFAPGIDEVGFDDLMTPAPENFQPQPLETAWKVERRTPPNTSNRQGSDLPVQPPPVALEIQKILQETIPGQPTDSPVEALPPRLPRPAMPVHQAPSPTIQRTPEEPETETSSKPTEMIQTPVGPLPSDLWKLLGQKPPEPVQAQVKPSSTPEPTTASMSTSASSSTNPRITPVIAPSNTIQRELDAAADQSSPASRLDSSSERQSEGQPARSGEPDMEELTHKVYAEVKRRLSVEWERLRHRF